MNSLIMPYEYNLYLVSVNSNPNFDRKGMIVLITVIMI